MPTYAHHVLEAIQNFKHSVSLQTIIEFVKKDRIKHGSKKTSERHINKAITKLINGKIIKKTESNNYCMVDSSPETKKLAATNSPRISKTKSKKKHNKKLTAYNLFTKYFMCKNKEVIKQNIIMKEMSKEWKRIKSNKLEHDTWKKRAREQCLSFSENTHNSDDDESMNFQLDVADLSAEFEDINKLPQINAFSNNSTSSMLKVSSSNVPVPIQSKGTLRNSGDIVSKSPQNTLEEAYQHHNNSESYIEKTINNTELYKTETINTKQKNKNDTETSQAKLFIKTTPDLLKTKTVVTDPCQAKAANTETLQAKSSSKKILVNQKQCKTETITETVVTDPCHTKPADTETSQKQCKTETITETVVTDPCHTKPANTETSQKQCKMKTITKTVVTDPCHTETSQKQCKTETITKTVVTDPCHTKPTKVETLDITPKNDRKIIDTKSTITHSKKEKESVGNQTESKKNMLPTEDYFVNVFGEPIPKVLVNPMLLNSAIWSDMMQNLYTY